MHAGGMIHTVSRNNQVDSQADFPDDVEKQRCLHWIEQKRPLAKVVASVAAPDDVVLGKGQAPMAAASTADDTPEALAIGMGMLHTVPDTRDAE